MISRERLMVWMLAAVFLASGVLGGGDTSPLLSTFVELPSCLLGAVAIAGLMDGKYPREANAALILLGLICLVPILDLIPLSVGIWKGLSGHNIPYSISSVAGLGDLPRPISLDPDQTRITALTLIVPSACFTAALQLDQQRRDQIMVVIVVFAFISSLLGAFQVASGGGLDLGIYRQVHDGYPIGFFANRNHEACLLLIAIPMSAHLIRLGHLPHGSREALGIAAVMIFSLSVVATASRSGFALLPLAWAGSLVVWIGDWRDRRLWFGIAGLIGLVLLAFGLLDLTSVGQRVIHRFNDVGEDLRPFIWRGTWAAIKSFWPFGSGVGSFVPVYKMFEDLNAVNEAWVNHAHNDYLEILLETGLLGTVLFALYLALVALAVVRRPDPVAHNHRYVAICAIVILLAHSLTDYPLRTFGLLTIFALANAMLFPPRTPARSRRSRSRSVSSPPDSFGTQVSHD